MNTEEYLTARAHEMVCTTCNVLPCVCNRPRGQWEPWIVECHDCGETRRRADDMMGICSLCGEPVCLECSCTHEGTCWRVPASEHRSCCGTLLNCPCTCHRHD